jgi:hypothetical protein
MTAPLDVARNAWGEALPDWVEALALECGLSSQNKVAVRLGRSAAMISLILRAKCPCRQDRGLRPAAGRNGRRAWRRGWTSYDRKLVTA